MCLLAQIRSFSILLSLIVRLRVIEPQMLSS